MSLPFSHPQAVAKVGNNVQVSVDKYIICSALDVIGTQLQCSHKLAPNINLFT